MTLNAVLSILGSLASLAAIPLSFYLYLRGKEARVSQVRREVVKALSYQIGEGRDLTLFTVRAVIRSKLREERAKGDEISVEEVVEDLVTETMIEPMLDPGRKDIILGNLSQLYHLGPISQILQRYPITAAQLARWVAQEYDLSPKELALADRATDMARSSPAERSPSPRLASTLFGLLSVLMSLVLFGVFEKELSGLFDAFSKSLPLIEILAGAGGTLVGLLVTVLAGYFWDKNPDEARKRGRPDSGSHAGETPSIPGSAADS